MKIMVNGETRDATPEEVAVYEQQMQACAPKDREILSAIQRQNRNNLLAASDWTELPSCGLPDVKKQAWAPYRQALRDVPQQAGFPWEVTWPVKP